MLSLPYFYFYVISSVLVFALGDTMKKIEPANSSLLSIMGTIGLITRIANYLFLILCLFKAEHWWYALIMWLVGFIISILIPPAKAESNLGYIAIVCAPMCTIVSYITLLL